ncbi:unnamed protein product [Heterobilharzia americana]|nr:unnamed protein product [Heterobilharzia americana]
MLDFLNLSKSGFMCELCRGNIKGENCVPQSCTHMFHVGCLEDWASEFDSSLEFACPVPGCSSSFSDILVRKTPGAINFTITSLKGNQCPICCERIQKPVATPESCNHAFCYMCLKEWSRVRHECPLDRGAYELILLSDRVGGPITKRVSAPPVKQQPPETPPLELDTNCEICQRPDDEAHLLLCDHCDRGYHTYCLPTPLSSIPDGDWFCPDCLRHGVVRPEAAAANASDRRVRRNIRRRLIDSEAEESDNDELTTTIDDSSSENLHLRRELSFTAQRRLEQQAMRRHRGRQLLQDLIEDLSERATSEASIRARRRNSQRQRVRNQLASESANLDSSGPSHVSQTTICFEISSSTNQPVSFRLGRATNNSSSNNRNHNCNTVQAECGGYSSSTNQLEVSRRRLRILSSSDSESDDPNGVVLRRVKLTSKRPRLIRSPSGESDSEGSSRITGPSSTLNTNWLAESDSDVQTNSVSRKNGEQKSTTSQSSFTSSIQNSTSENIQHEYDSKHSDFAESYAPAVKRTQRNVNSQERNLENVNQIK